MAFRRHVFYTNNRVHRFGVGVVGGSATSAGVVPDWIWLGAALCP